MAVASCGAGEGRTHLKRVSDFNDTREVRRNYTGIVVNLGTTQGRVVGQQLIEETVKCSICLDKCQVYEGRRQRFHRQCMHRLAIGRAQKAGGVEKRARRSENASHKKGQELRSHGDGQKRRGVLRR
jgi:hypothetical protein